MNSRHLPGITCCLLVLVTTPIRAQDDRVTFRLESDDVQPGQIIEASEGDTLSLVFRTVVDTEETDIKAVVSAIGVTGPISSIANSVEGLTCAIEDLECISEMVWPDGDGTVFFYSADIMDPSIEPVDGPLAGLGPQGNGISFSLVSGVFPPPGSNLAPGTTVVGYFSLQIEVSEDFQTETFELTYRDGFKKFNPDDSLTLLNQAVEVDEPLTPVTESFTFQVARTGSVNVLPGDFNLDASVDLMDTIDYLDHLFLGQGELPACEPAGGLSLLDANGDGELDLSDALYMLRESFLAGPPHVLGRSCVSLQDCPRACP